MDKSQFKVGSLNDLMELNELFAKFDTQLTNTCNKLEKTYYDMSKELNQQPNMLVEIQQARGAAKKVSIQDYLRDFTWDQIKFQRDKSLKILGQKIQGN